jgi:hypothetical protein
MTIMIVAGFGLRLFHLLSIFMPSDIHVRSLPIHLLKYCIVYVWIWFCLGPCVDAIFNLIHRNILD